MFKGKFGPRDVACYADSAFGHDHARKVLADLVEMNAWRVTNDAKEVCRINSLIDELRGEMSDDDCETDEALEFLNEKCCTKGVYFDFENGDLILFPESEADHA